MVGMVCTSAHRPSTVGPVAVRPATAAVFSSFADLGVERVDAVATSAIRDAANRDELLDAIRERAGLRRGVVA